MLRRLLPWPWWHKTNSSPFMLCNRGVQDAPLLKCGHCLQPALCSHDSCTMTDPCKVQFELIASMDDHHIVLTCHVVQHDWCHLWVVTAMTITSEYRVCSASDGVHCLQCMLCMSCDALWQSRHHHAAAESTTCLHTCQRSVRIRKCSSCKMLLSACTHQSNRYLMLKSWNLWKPGNWLTGYKYKQETHDRNGW